MRLNRLYWIKKEIYRLESQIRELTLLRSTAADCMPHGKGRTSSTVENTVIRIEALCDKLRDKLAEYTAERARIEAFISGIEDDESRLIARMRFVDNLSYSRIGEELHIDRTTAQKKIREYINLADKNG